MFLGSGYEAGETGNRSLDVELVNRTHHIHCIGKPGSGKSAWLRTQIHQAIGEHFAVFDPESVLTETTLQALAEANIPQEDIIVIDPEAQQRLGVTVPLNVLKPQPGVDPHSQIEGLLGACKRAWHDGWGARSEDLFRNSFLLLQELGLTMAALPRLLSSPDYRDGLASRSKNVLVKSYFLDHLHAVPKGQLSTWIEAPRNKVSQLMLNPFVAPMLSTADCLDFSDVLASKALVVNLNEKALGDSGRLLGMFLVSMIYNAALKRPEGSPTFTVFADV